MIHLPRLRFIRGVLVGVGLLCLLPVLYYWNEVAEARRETPALIAEALRRNPPELRIDQFTAKQLKALLLVQDPNFYEHKGWDFLSGRITTITQALVKIYYFQNFQPGLAKIRQSLIARFALDPLVSKDRQLELFINSAYMGSMAEGEVIGFQQASRVYFNRDFAQLDEDQYLALLGMLNGPNPFNPIRFPEASTQRVAEIRQLLAERQSQ